MGNGRFSSSPARGEARENDCCRRILAVAARSNEDPSITLCGSLSSRIGNRCLVQFTALVRESRLWVRLFDANRVPVIAHRGAIGFLQPI